LNVINLKSYSMPTVKVEVDKEAIEDLILYGRKCVRLLKLLNFVTLGLIRKRIDYQIELLAEEISKGVTECVSVKITKD